MGGAVSTPVVVSEKAKDSGVAQMSTRWIADSSRVLAKSVAVAPKSALYTVGAIPLPVPVQKLKASVRMTREAWAVASLYPQARASEEKPKRARRPRATVPAAAAEKSRVSVTERAIGPDQPQLEGERVPSADSIPEYAMRFAPPAQVLFRIDSEPSLVRFLPATAGRSDPLRIVRQKSRLAEWYEVEAYSGRSKEWILRHTSPTEKGAREFADGFADEDGPEAPDPDAEAMAALT